MSQAYYHTKESVEEYVKMAEGHSGTELIRKLKDFLSADARVLEIGSGPGTDWKILSSSYSVVGSDNSEEFLSRLIKENPGNDFLKLDASTLDTDQAFDCIYSNKVLHHLKDEELETSIKRQFEILNPEGIICHSFWEGEGSEVFKGLFVNYHNHEDIKKLFSNYFDILLIEDYQEFEKGDSVLMIGKRK